jgi:hypothetical protein
MLKLVEISNGVYVYDKELWCSRSFYLRHVQRRNTAVAVKHGDPLGKLVSLGSLGSYMLL